MQAAESAAQMTQQLLAFSQKGTINYKPFDTHTVLHYALSILRHSIDRRIEIQFNANADHTIVKGDPTLLQNAILNLCINARDAMPEGGELNITTTNTILDDLACNTTQFAVKPGEYIQIIVSDNGVGMSHETIQKAFEPFFTTKKDFGTGLGLSAVYGTIRELQGSIDVTTAPGKGTAFTILLPLAGTIGEKEFLAALEEQNRIMHAKPKKPEPLKPKPDKPETNDSKQHKACILIVDDEAVIRNILTSALTTTGYQVLAVGDGIEAIEIFKKQHEQIDAVLLDMLMPRMNGEECFKLLREIEPDVKVIVQSGFAAESEMEAMFNKGIKAFLRKPYKLGDIIEAVQKALA
jgi:CheY-like chemotaxis protein